MCRRGGRRRRPEGRGGQPSPAITHSSQQRSDGGGGGGGGRGRGDRGRGVSHSASTHTPPLPSTDSSSSYVPPPSGPSPGASSSKGESASPPLPSPVVDSPGIEAAVEKSTLTPAVKPSPASSKALAPPKRPDIGTIGQKVVLLANHFRVQFADKDLYHYNVSISPEVTSKKVCRDIINQLVDMYRESHLGNRYMAYDGGNSVYVAGELPFSSKDFHIKLVDKDCVGSASANRSEREFKVSIKFASKPELHHLDQFLGGRQQDAPSATIQALNVVLRSHPYLISTVVGRSFFASELGCGTLGNGVEYWRGYHQSLRPVQMGLSLNIDISTSCFYEPLLVIDYVAKHFNLSNFSQPLSDQLRLEIKGVLTNVKVKLTYTNNSGTYKITGISKEPLSKLTFSLSGNNTKTSVVQYLQERYGVVLDFLSLPALQAGTNAIPIYLPMEVCKIVKGQRYTKRLNVQQVTQLLRETCQPPHERKNSIEEIVKKNNYDDKLVVKDFGIQVLLQLCKVDARVLPPPMLQYHHTGKVSRVKPRMGKWSMTDKKMVDGGRVDYWTCVSFSSKLDPGILENFCKKLVEMCNSKGMVFNQTPLIPIQTKDPHQIENALTEVHKQCEAKLQRLGQKNCFQLLITILPDVTSSYGQIKRICETKLGIVTQCCRERHVEMPSTLYLESVSLKVNVKVGGRNTVLSDTILKSIPLVSEKPIIIFGADVTHPGSGDGSSSSIAAVVASMDWPGVTKYRGLVSAQTHNEEIIEDLYKSYLDPQKGLVHAGLIREHFIAFHRFNNRKPERIIFYRDGVGEGQFSQVLLYEMDAIRKACASFSEDYQPTVTFIVVQKRHHTRFFPTSQDAGERGNILPGTVIDTTICHPTEFDFYLNSHAGTRGTSRPAHYHVLYDENKFSADQLQMLTNSLCYTYARCTRSVSVVPPVYYAHLAAFRARYYIEGDTPYSGSAVGGGDTVVRPLPTIDDKVKDVMFYV